MGKVEIEADLRDAFNITRKVMGKAPATVVAEVFVRMCRNNSRHTAEGALTVLGSINTELTTDQHFANADKTVKWCKDVEQRLEAAKQHALSQTASIDELFRTLDAIAEETRAKRLELDKLVKARKEAIRLGIKTNAEAAWQRHVAAINARLAPVVLPEIRADFAGVMKGKKTVAGLRDAADTELARVKIEANGLADKIDANLRTIRAAGHHLLFADLQLLAIKEADDLAAIIDNRIAQHAAAEKEKLERERETIRQQEEAKARPTLATPQPELVATDPSKAQSELGQAGWQTVSTISASTANRPTDRQIIETLALAFRVHESKVIEWLSVMDLEDASQELETAF